jgi:hypothetical protein
MGRDELLQQVEDGFQELLASLDRLSDEQMTIVWFGQWCVRDILAHVAGWHREMAAAFDRIARGERPVPEGVDYNEPDAWNARFAAARRDTGPAAMLEELKASKEAFAAAARQVPEERFEEGRAAYRILRGSGIDHYREHAPAIREWRQREGI